MIIYLGKVTTKKKRKEKMTKHINSLSQTLLIEVFVSTKQNDETLLITTYLSQTSLSYMSDNSQISKLSQEGFELVSNGFLPMQFCFQPISLNPIHLLHHYYTPQSFSTSSLTLKCYPPNSIAPPLLPN